MYGGDEEYATGRRIATRSSPGSPESGNSNDSNELEEPFFSSLSYIEAQQQRLDSDSTGSHSTRSRFRYEPRVIEVGGDDDDADDDDGSITDTSRRSSANRHRDLASRFLETSFDQEDSPPAKTQPSRSINADLFGFLTGINSPQENNFWDQHSERGTQVDQSVNLMDVNMTSYEHQPRDTKSTRTQALKQPFSLLLQPSSPKRQVANPVASREAKPLMDIDLSNNLNSDDPTASSAWASRKDVAYRRSQSLVMLGLFLVVVSTFIAFVTVPKHGGRLFELDAQNVASANDTDAFVVEQSNLTKQIPEESSSGDASHFKIEDNLTAGSVEDPGDSNVTMAAKQGTTTSISKKAATGGAGEKSGDGKLDAISDSEPTITEETWKEDNQKARITNPLLDAIAMVPQNGSRKDAIRYILAVLDVSEAADLDDPDTAAYQALEWISDYDDLQLAVPGFDTTVRYDPNIDNLLHQILERYALAVLFFEMGSDPKYKGEASKENREKFEETWIKGTTCEWFGVQCQEHRVAALKISKSLLVGRLPREIFSGVALPKLTSLDLSYNSIQGWLPNLVSAQLAPRWSFSPIKELHLQHNQMGGHLDSMMELKNLSYVDISHNGFNGDIPEYIDNLSNLEFLSMYNNGLEHDLPTSLGSLTKLTTLHLDGNKFAGTVPSALGRLQSLETLRLLDNRLTGTVPGEVCDLLSLGSLEVLIADCSRHQISCDCCTTCWRG
ncbi:BRASSINOSTEROID INSENSITIVE 1-associated receptor kinase 1 [Seminavis robusta]|uniref:BRASSINOSTEROID INSENSITIVE 1-associated receptor kinase 1 n=1 Tax=Seminavis robusta TaxID=568900 RepID=A0A9N8HS38_9STRA|nr:BRASSINOSTEROID INSENSITIVE 1-associated receptor kinase 1 [Seminavis robusta]|eukprot:Sro1131_g244630.1 BRASSINOSTEROID INSENSITIVE 1-associated receptor kinase 1 (727) ;mRNA; r:13210-15642